MQKIKNSILVLVIALAGCQTLESPSLFDSFSSVDNPKALPSAKKEIVIDQEVMKDCEDLKILPYPATFEDTLLIHSQNTQIYVNCKLQNAGKKKVLEDFVLKRGK